MTNSNLFLTVVWCLILFVLHYNAIKQHIKNNDIDLIAKFATFSIVADLLTLIYYWNEYSWTKLFTNWLNSFPQIIT